MGVTVNVNVNGITLKFSEMIWVEQFMRWYMCEWCVFVRNKSAFSKVWAVHVLSHSPVQFIVLLWYGVFFHGIPIVPLFQFGPVLCCLKKVFVDGKYAIFVKLYFFRAYMSYSAQILFFFPRSFNRIYVHMFTRYALSPFFFHFTYFMYV